MRDGDGGRLSELRQGFKAMGWKSFSSTKGNTGSGRENGLSAEPEVVLLLRAYCFVMDIKPGG